MGTEKIAGKGSPGDVADAGPWQAGLAAPSTQFGGLPTDWVVLFLPSLGRSSHLSLISTLTSLSLSRYVRKEREENREARRKEGRKRREKKVQKK